MLLLRAWPSVPRLGLGLELESACSERVRSTKFALCGGLGKLVFVLGRVFSFAISADILSAGETCMGCVRARSDVVVWVRECDLVRGSWDSDVEIVVRRGRAEREVALTDGDRLEERLDGGVGGLVVLVGVGP